MNQNKINKLNSIFKNASDIISEALNPPTSETTNECFDFVKERIESTTGYLFNDDTKLLIIEKE